MDQYGNIVGHTKYDRRPIYDREPTNVVGKDEAGGPWTEFWDMHSGGGLKEPYHFIYIEAPEAEAEIIFYNRFDHSPGRVSCTCCGEDYSVTESKTLAEATNYRRGCLIVTYRIEGVDKSVSVEEPSHQDYEAKRYLPLDEWLEKYKAPGTEDSVLVIRKEDIKPEERVGSVPRQGFVWQD
jgi:hypothetical protein